MKQSTQKMIRSMLAGPFDTDDCIEILDKLFAAYAREEINYVEDLYEAPDDFCQVVLNSINRSPIFRKADAYAVMYEAIYRYYNILSGLVSAENIDAQLLFSDMVREVQPGRNPIILDEASGKIPFSSIELADDHDQVSSMDKFIIPVESLKKFNVNGINEYMTPETDLSGYDFVVAHHPCESTSTLIKNCAKHNMQYFIHFCACGLPYDERRGVPSKQWEEKLRMLDPRIKFTTFEALDGMNSARRMRFGYVLDIPQKDVEELLRSYFIIHEPKKDAVNLAREKFIASIKNSQPGS